MKYCYENFSTTVFPGFYESILDPFYDSNYLLGTEIPDGFYTDYIDFHAYQQEASKLWWEAVNKATENKDEIDLCFTGELKGIDSPREYNFRTDRTNIEVDFDFQKLCKYCFGTHAKQFDEYLYKHWSDREGFWSFIPNNIKKFKEEKDIDVMIEFFLLENCNFETVEFQVLEEIDCLAYENTCLVDDKWNKWKFEYDNENDCYKPTLMIKEIA